MSENERPDHPSTEPSEAPDSPAAESAEDSGAPAAEPKSPFRGRPFWMLNSIEAFERLAYNGLRYVAPVYIMQATEPGGLHLTAVDKGVIYLFWAYVQSFLPIFIGGYADRYGYKRVLAFAMTTNVIGYLLMAFFHSYAGFFAGVLVLAFGTAFFKPSLQGSLAQLLPKKYSSLGWGTFYWVVNVGAFIAPYIATVVLGNPHSAEGWRDLFLVCAGFTGCNLLLLLTFKDVPSGASKTESAWVVMKRTVKGFLDKRLVAWLLIMSCFWLMMYQLWDLHPNFIQDWVDSSMLVGGPVPWEYGDRGLVQVPQQVIVSLNAGLIIVLVVPLSWLVRKLRTLTAMMIGMSVATCGILVAGVTSSGLILVLGIFFFSVGEMLVGPKKNEYLGLISPPGKKAMYLGYLNFPVGFGVAFGSLIAGFVYNGYGDKANLSIRYLANQPQLVGRAAQSIDWSDSLQRVVKLTGVERENALDIAAGQLGKSREQAAEHLVRSFRTDHGQTVNLALQYLAAHPELSDKTAAALKRKLKKSDDPVAKDFVAGKRPYNEAIAARFADRLAKTSGYSRTDATKAALDLMHKQEKLEPSAFEDYLWQRFARHPENLTNFALEYLAQGTPLLAEAVGRLELEDPEEEIPDRVGIGRTKAFGALAAARGVRDEELDAHLSVAFASVEPASDRVYSYLVSLDHVRFNRVARRNWKEDTTLLRTLVESDPAAVQAAREELGSEGELDYAELAKERDAVLAALEAKDWARRPGEAAALLGLNPWEARWMARAERNQARLDTTEALWEEYDPQFHVWIPFAIVGILATIAIGIFGQMAKRWKDMNA